MLIEIILAITIGILLGCITGLVPGVHINMVAVVTFSLSPILLTYTSPLILAIVIISMSITHTFLDSLPSIFLGAPDEDHALSVLPGHRLLLQGQGYQAVTLTTIGSLFAVIITALLVPLLIPISIKGYPLIQDYIPYLLIISSLFLIGKESKSRFWALTIFMLSGALGIATLNLNLSQPLFPLFSGLFGTSILLLSLLENTKIPKQVIEFPKVKKKELIKALSSGFFASFLTGFLPGLGSAQAAIIGSSLYKKILPETFLILTGSISTFVMAISFVALFSIDKARNGSVVIISKIMQSITFDQLIIFMAVSMIVAGIATILTLKLSKIFSRIMEKVNYKKLTISIIVLIAVLVLILTGPTGFLVLIVATFLGMLPSLKGIAKNHLMGSLLLPVILFFLL